ncbi:MAG: phosphotyrosine protein phosphatase [Moraxellaceae bacterium]|nr:MAG: phosphotyrosine protein phosphatase [Moraxellaceae bacterium]
MVGNVSGKVSVLFVCLGNICRSSTAEAVLRSVVLNVGLDDCVEVASCGTAGYHIGEVPDSRSREVAKARGYDMATLRASQLQDSDFEYYDFILAMDESNLANLTMRCPQACLAKLELFLTYAQSYDETEVPDPYYGGDQGFDHVLDLVEDACAGLLDAIKRSL